MNITTQDGCIWQGAAEEWLPEPGGHPQVSRHEGRRKDRGPQVHLCRGSGAG